MRAMFLPVCSKLPLTSINKSQSHGMYSPRKLTFQSGVKVTMGHGVSCGDGKLLLWHTGCLFKRERLRTPHQCGFGVLLIQKISWIWGMICPKGLGPPQNCTNSSFCSPFLATGCLCISGILFQATPEQEKDSIYWLFLITSFPSI